MAGMFGKTKKTARLVVLLLLAIPMALLLTVGKFILKTITSKVANHGEGNTSNLSLAEHAKADVVSSDSCIIDTCDVSNAGCGCGTGGSY